MNLSLKDPKLSALNQSIEHPTVPSPMPTHVGLDPIAVCQEIIAKNSKSFSFASRFLPPSARADAAVLYAWCRRVDDAVDEVSPELAPHSLKRLQTELDLIYSDHKKNDAQSIIDTDPVLSGFEELVNRCRIPKYYPQELLEGMLMDVEETQYDTLEQLYLYCFRVASVVGLMMCHILKIRDESSLKNAAHLGVAMQLTNICRDVSEDWGRSRLYLPRELLIKGSSNQINTGYDVTEPSLKSDPSSIISGKSGLRFDRLALPPMMVKPARYAIHELLSRADLHYNKGYAGLSSLPGRARFAIRAAGMIYQDIGRIIREHECDPNQPRAITSKSRKLSLAAVALLKYGLHNFSDILRRLFRKPSSFTVPRHTLLFEDFIVDHDRERKAHRELQK